MNGFTGNGIGNTADTAAWWKNRQLFQPAFHRSKLDQFKPAMERQVDIFMQIIKEKVSENVGKVADVREILFRLTLDIVFGE